MYLMTRTLVAGEDSSDEKSFTAATVEMGNFRGVMIENIEAVQELTEKILASRVNLIMAPLGRRLGGHPTATTLLFIFWISYQVSVPQPSTNTSDPHPVSRCLEELFDTEDGTKSPEYSTPVNIGHRHSTPVAYHNPESKHVRLALQPPFNEVMAPKDVHSARLRVHKGQFGRLLTCKVEAHVAKVVPSQ